MPVERREQAIVVEIGSTGVIPGGTRMFNGRRQPSRGGTSRMTRECQVRICERLGVKFPGPTRRHHGWPPWRTPSNVSASPRGTVLIGRSTFEIRTAGWRNAQQNAAICTKRTPTRRLPERKTLESGYVEAALGYS